MSCVTSKFIENKQGNSEYKMKSYAIDDTFHIDITRLNLYERTQHMHMNLSVAEAGILKEQLEQFIRMNQIKR